MFYRKILTLLKILTINFFVPVYFVQAAIVINEINYDLNGSDAGREWIEIYNDGDDSVDFSDWKLFENKTNHGLGIVQGDKIIKPKSYALIVSDFSKFKVDWPNFSGTVFDSSFSLNNNGDTIAIKDKNLNIIDQITYNSSMGASGDGKSLQKNINGLWGPSLPTPGSVNSATGDSGSSASSASNSPANSSTSPSTLVEFKDNNKETKQSFSALPKEDNSGSAGQTMSGSANAKIISQNIAFVNTPIDLQAQIISRTGDKISFGKYFWNFGDGQYKEFFDNSKFNYSYAYPGDYVISLEYYPNNYSKEPESTYKKIIHVIPMNLSISKIGDEKDFFIEIHNGSQYDLDISEYEISYGLNKKFIFPRGSLVLAGKKIVIPASVVNLQAGEEKNLKIISKNGNIVYDYGSYLAKIPAKDKKGHDVQESNQKSNIVTQSNKQKQKQTQIVNKKTETKKTIETIEEPEIETKGIPNNVLGENNSFSVDHNQNIVGNLQANITSAKTEKTENNTGDKLFYVSGLIVLLIISASTIYFIRQNRIPEGMNYKIYDFDK